MARAMPSGAFVHDRFESLADRLVVIVGFGGIGQALARRLEGFECEIIPVARTARPGVLPIQELPRLLPTADVVVLAVPLDDATRGMVDDAFLSSMRDGALLVNVGRGALVDTGALQVHVSSGRVRAALDVTDPEPLPADHPLWRTPGIFISPHVGGNTSAFLPRVSRLVAHQIVRWLAGEPLVNVIVS